MEKEPTPKGSRKAACSFRTRLRAMNIVGQPFQAAGWAGFPARRTYWGLESPQNRQAGIPAPQGGRSWKTLVAIERFQHPSGVSVPGVADQGDRTLRSRNPRLISANPPAWAEEHRPGHFAWPAGLWGGWRGVFWRPTDPFKAPAGVSK